MNASTTSGGIRVHDSSAAALWEKLSAFSFDPARGPDTFAIRLAREQGWSAAFTERAIEEYRRFLLLFALEQRREREGTPTPDNALAVRVVPSAVVDKVWHLHLLYTQSYWETLCRDILGQSLHHQPANGTGDESVLLDDVYRANMEAYQQTFGEAAPSDIWSPAKQTPPSGTPLAEILGPATPRPFLLNLTLYVLFAAGSIALVAHIRLGAATGDAAAGSAPMKAIWIFLGIIVALRLCTGTFEASMGGAPGRRRSGDGGVWGFLGGAGDSGSGTATFSSGDHGHSHGSHDGGHSDSGGGHSCGGHGCGGHGCGGGGH